MGTTQEAQIERVYDLLVSRGPATAYAYMEQSGGKDSFPAPLVNLVRIQLECSISRTRPLVIG
jgi:hypothetical protein